MHRLVRKVTAVSTLALSCSAVFAAESLDARVVAVDGDRVVLETKGPVPAWVTQDGVVLALGWQTRVTAVEDSGFIVSLAESRASRVKIDSAIVVREIPSQESFGC